MIHSASGINKQEYVTEADEALYYSLLHNADRLFVIVSFKCATSENVLYSQAFY